VVAVFDAPVAADGVCGEERCRLEVGEVVGGLAAVFPKAGLGVALETITLDADDALDETVPIAAQEGIAYREDLGEALFVA